MSGKIYPIVWNDALMTGITTIDDQHKILVNMLNEANERLRVQNEELTRAMLNTLSDGVYATDMEGRVTFMNAGSPCRWPATCGAITAWTCPSPSPSTPPHPVRRRPER